MTEPLAPSLTISSMPLSATSSTPGSRELTSRRALTAGALVLALLGALSLITTVWASPSGAAERQVPSSEAPPTTQAADGPSTSVAGAGAAPTTTPLVEQRPLPGETTPTEPVDKGGALNNILPRPNSGHEPTYQGDRGTGSQYAVLGAMILALGVIIALVTRQSRRSKARWGAATPMAGTSQAGVAAGEAPGNKPGTPAADGQGSDAP